VVIKSDARESTSLFEAGVHKWSIFYEIRWRDADQLIRRTQSTAGTGWGHSGAIIDYTNKQADRW